jgi:hypothetical protein
MTRACKNLKKDLKKSNSAESWRQTMRSFTSGLFGWRTDSKSGRQMAAKTSDRSDDSARSVLAGSRC